MLANDYQKQALETDLMQGNVLYHILGLISEVGEIAAYLYITGYTEFEQDVDAVLDRAVIVAQEAGRLKKKMRDEGFTAEHMLSKEFNSKELGDAQWYLAATANDLFIHLGTIMDENIKHLKDRKARNVISGSGDNR